jgi:hypothetical protein
MISFGRIGSFAGWDPHPAVIHPVTHRTLTITAPRAIEESIEAGL